MRPKRHSAKQRQGGHKLHAKMPSRDVKTTGRESETRRVRRRKRRQELVGAVRAMIAGMVGMMALIGSVIGLHQVFYKNPDFSVADIQIYTDGQLTRERVLAFAEIPEGQNIFRLDLEALHARLEEISVVRTVLVERRLPNRLVIQIEERHPIAWLSVPALGIEPGGSGYAILLDRDGVPMRGEQLVGTFGDLPIIQATGAGAYPIGKPIPDESLRVASALIDWWVALPELGAGGIEKIRQLNDYSIRAEFEGGLAVTFGIEDLSRQLSNLDLILRHAVTENRRVETVNLMPKKNIPVVYAKATSVAPLNLRPVAGGVLE